MERDEARPIQPPPMRTEESQAQQIEASRLQVLRASYANHIASRAGLAPETGRASEITAALASIPRERFLGPPPWRIVSPAGHTLALPKYWLSVLGFAGLSYALIRALHSLGMAVPWAKITAETALFGLGFVVQRDLIFVAGPAPDGTPNRGRRRRPPGCR